MYLTERRVRHGLLLQAAMDVLEAGDGRIHFVRCQTQLVVAQQPRQRKSEPCKIRRMEKNVSMSQLTSSKMLWPRLCDDSSIDVI